MPHSKEPEISVVLPFHNEAGNVDRLFDRLVPEMEKVVGGFEIICIDDGSSDETHKLLRKRREADARIKIIRLARNFGKEAAITCGIRMSRGRAAITMDSDLQHPPEVIKELVAAWKDGAKTVYAVRRNRDTDSALRRFFSKAFYAVFRRIADISLPEGAGDFRLLDRKVVEAVNSLPEKSRFMKGIMTWVGFDHALVPFDVAARAGGLSHWNFFNLFRFAFDGLSSFSTFPLRIWTWCGVFISLCALAYGGYIGLRTLAFGIDTPGYASLITSILFMGGIQLLSLGLMGEYLARIFTEVKDRPIYIISESSGFD